jgi:hypothetical protein
VGGATVICGSFEGNDKSCSPISGVLDEAFLRRFNRKPKGRLLMKIAALLGTSTSEPESLVERALLEIKYNEEAVIPPDVAKLLLPVLKAYQDELHERSGIARDLDAITARLGDSTRAKYGTAQDDGWHLYCLWDLVPACEKSLAEAVPVQIVW